MVRYSPGRLCGTLLVGSCVLIATGAQYGGQAQVQKRETMKQCQSLPFNPDRPSAGLIRWDTYTGHPFGTRKQKFRFLKPEKHHWRWSENTRLDLSEEHVPAKGPWAFVAKPKNTRTSIQPSDPDLIPEGVELLNYLNDLYQAGATENTVLSGHWQGASFKRGKSYHFELGEVMEIRRQTGKYVGLVSGWICPGEFGYFATSETIGDTMWYDDMIADYTLWWRNGGIVHVAASFFAPLEDRFGGRKEEGISVDVDRVLEPGTPENKRWRYICDRMATFFLAMQERGIPVIFRPFTESYIGVFWYSYRHWRIGIDQSIRIQRDLHDYLTKEKGCHNIIWDFQGLGKQAPNYPGDEYVDIRTTKSEYVAWDIDSFQTLTDRDAPWGNAELGDYGSSKRAREAGKEEIPWNVWLETMKKKAPNMMMYIIWFRDWGPVKSIGHDYTYRNYDAGYNEMIANPYTLTRDEISITPAPPDLPYTNDFESSSAVDDWTQAYGNWVLEDGMLKQTMDGESNTETSIFFGNTNWEDYSIEATLHLTDAGMSAGIMGRCATTLHYYRLSFFRNKELRLERIFRGEAEILGTWSGMFGSDIPYGVRLDMRGDSIEAHIDVGDGMKRRISVTDDKIANGCIGFSTYRRTAGFDNLRVAAVLAPDGRADER